MIEVIGLLPDGSEQPQFFMLTFKFPNMGEGYQQTTQFGTEAYLRGFLKKNGIAETDIDALFRSAR